MPVHGSTGDRRLRGRLDPVFLPPPPPPLDAAPPPAGLRAPGRNVPGEFTAFVNEPFYAPLGALLASPGSGATLSGEQKRRLETYRADKAALQTELRARLYTLRESEPAARLQALEALAREQTRQLSELEQTAENLRGELARASDGGTALRPGNPAGSGLSPGKSPPDQPAILRWAVFFSPDLSPAQRRLVREILIELDDPERGTGPSGSMPGWMFFSPDTARLHLPSPLPAGLADRIADYERTKNALKRELRDALCATDGHPPAGSPAEALQSLAGSQAPRIAAAEALAEEIRRGLQGSVPDPLHVPRLSQLPAGLGERIAAYRRSKLGLQKELLAKVHEISGRDANAGSSAPQDKLQQTIGAFTRDNAARYAALEKEKEGIRADLARLGADRADETAQRQSADGLMKNFTDSFQQYELWRLYYEYRIAVYEPGLSPEQRRLLFDLGVEKLALPPPPGFLQPFQ